MRVFKRKLPARVRFFRDINLCGPKFKNLGSCWIWTRGSLSKGCHYGQISVKKRNVRVHRYSWQLHFGEIPEGMSVLHKCDNPLCVNPSHLFLGSQKDNQADMVSKDRQNKGEERPASKLTEDEVREIRRRYKKVSQGHGNGRALAREFRVSKTTIYFIVTGKIWRYLL